MTKKKGTKTKPRRKKAGGPARVSAKFKALSKARRAKLAPKKKLITKKAPPVPKLSSKLQKRVDEQNKKAEALMARGRERGFVTYDEILKSFPNIETDVKFLELLYEMF